MGARSVASDRRRRRVAQAGIALVAFVILFVLARRDRDLRLLVVGVLTAGLFMLRAAHRHLLGAVTG